jgi:hypothetical protein
MKTILYKITLTSPAIFARAENDPNTLSTLHYVPGSAIWGALANRYIHNKSPMNDPVMDSGFRKLFLSGRTRFLNAYPAGGENMDKRMLPAPLSLFVPKENVNKDEGKVYDFSTDFDEFTFDGNQFVRNHFGFIRWDGHKITWRTPGLKKEMHYATKHEAEEKVIFQYESLLPGEKFIGLIEMDFEDRAIEKTISSEIQHLIKQGPVYLGRSKSAEYGANVDLDVIAIEDNYHEVKCSIVDADDLVATLLSEYVGRDSLTGEPGISAFTGDLSSKLGIEKLELKRSFGEEKWLPGYNAYWKMPRPTSPVLAAGTVFVFKKPDNLSTEGVFSIGERTAEGYGRVAIGWQGIESDDEYFTYEKDIEVLISRTPGISIGNSKISNWFESEVLFTWLTELIPHKVSCIKINKNTALSGSVLGNLRHILSIHPNILSTQNFEAEIKELIGKKAPDKMKNLKLDVEGWSPQRVTLMSFLNSLTGNNGIKDAISFLEYDLNRPDIIQNAQLSNEMASRFMAVFVDQVIDHLRRSISREEI